MLHLLGDVSALQSNPSITPRSLCVNEQALGVLPELQPGLRCSQGLTECFTDGPLWLSFSLQLFLFLSLKN